MKKTLAILFTALLLTTPAAARSLPADVQLSPEIHTINTLLEYGVVGLCPDGRFHPDRCATREEAVFFTASLMRQLMPDTGWGYTAYADEYIDIWTTRWSAENIGLAAALGLIPRGGYFRPEEIMTRGDFADILYNYVKPLPSFDTSTYYFPDVTEENRSAGYLRAKNIMFGAADGCFHPLDGITRAEVCNALYAISGFPLIYAADNLPRRAVLDTPYVSQLSPVYAVVGCEGASLLMGLKAKGYAQDIGLRAFLDEMPKHPSNPAKGYVGSPYLAGQYDLRTTIYPAPLAAYASRYGKVTDISGADPREIRAELLSGNPVVIYATLRWAEPRYREYLIEGEWQTLLRNNHVVLLDGYDRDAGMYHVSDPYNDADTSKEYKYWIDAATLEAIYNVRRHALLIE